MKITHLLLFFIPFFTYSQNKQVLYGFTEIPQSSLLNPGALIENEWFFGVPLLSQIHANLVMSGVSIYDVFSDNGQDFNTKLRDAVYKMDSKDHFTINQQLEIFSGGFKFGNSYYKNQYLSFGLYQETDVFAYFPKDYAVLAYEGNLNNINRIFNFGDLNVSGTVFSVFHIGYNKKVNKKFTIGARGKIYSNILNVSSTKNSGTFQTVPGENNFYNHMFNLNLELQTSGISSLINDDNSEIDKDLKTLRRRLLFGGNLGFGLDIGFTYQPNKEWTFDASLQDIAFIKHSKDIENYELEGGYEFEGINVVFSGSEQGQTAQENWDNIAEEFENLFSLDTTRTKYTTWRPLKFNTSLSYAFGRKIDKNCNCLKSESGYINKVGAHVFAVNRPKQPQIAFSLFYYRHLFKSLRFKATYTADSYSFNNIGLGISTHLGPINFYLMADNLLEFQNLVKSQSVSLQVGLNYIFKQNEN